MPLKINAFCVSPNGKFPWPSLENSFCDEDRVYAKLQVNACREGFFPCKDLERDFESLYYSYSICMNLCSY